MQIGSQVRIVGEPFASLFPGVYTIVAEGTTPGTWQIDINGTVSDFDVVFLEEAD